MTENHTHSDLQVQKKENKKGRKKSSPCGRARTHVWQVQVHIQSVKGHREQQEKAWVRKRSSFITTMRNLKPYWESRKANREDKTQCGGLPAD